MANRHSRLTAGVLAAFAAAALLVSPAVADTFDSVPLEGVEVPLESVEAESYTLTVSDPSGKVGEELSVIVTVKAKGAFKVNKEYPHKVSVEPTDGLELPKPKLKKADAKLEEKTLTFTIPAKATRAGSFELAGVLKFSVCSSDACQLEKKDIKSKIAAK